MMVETMASKSPSHTRLLTHLCLGFSIFNLAAAERNCYLPDGTKAWLPQWLPCADDLADPLSNICCASNRTNPWGGKSSAGLTADRCLSNGLCQNHLVDDAGNHKFTYTRAYCTDADWTSGRCLDICGMAGSGFKPITPCDGTAGSTRWCCGTNTDCCGNTNALALAATFTTASTSSSTRKPATSSETTIAITTTASTDQPTSFPSSLPVAGADPLATGAKVGIAIGVVVLALALLALGAWAALTYQRRRKKTAAAKAAHSDPHDTYPLQYNLLSPAPSFKDDPQLHKAPVMMHEMEDRGIVELASYPHPPELGNQSFMSELPAHEVEKKPTGRA